MKRVFKQSIDNKEKIVLFYIDSSGEVTQRYVRVLKMNDNHILVYCHYRKSIRTLKIDNILAARSIKIGVA